MEIEFKNGSKIESLPSNDVTRGNGQLSNVRFFDNETGEEIFSGITEARVETIDDNIQQDFNYKKEVSFEFNVKSIDMDIMDELLGFKSKSYIEKLKERAKKQRLKSNINEAKDSNSNKLRDAQNKFHKHGKRW